MFSPLFLTIPQNDLTYVMWALYLFISRRFSSFHVTHDKHNLGAFAIEKHVKAHIVSGRTVLQPRQEVSMCCTGGFGPTLPWLKWSGKVDGFHALRATATAETFCRRTVSSLQCSSTHGSSWWFNYQYSYYYLQKLHSCFFDNDIIWLSEYHWNFTPPALGVWFSPIFLCVCVCVVGVRCFLHFVLISPAVLTDILFSLMPCATWVTYLQTWECFNFT